MASDSNGEKNDESNEKYVIYEKPAADDEEYEDGDKKDESEKHLKMMDKKIACEKLPPGWEKHEGSSNDLNLISNLTLRYFKITVDSTFGTLSLAPSRENCQTGRKSQRLQCCPLVLK